MEKRLENKISETVKLFLEKTKNKEILIVSHFDTDGITSGAIMSQALKKLDKQFSIRIIKSLEREFIKKLPKDKILIFLDLASGSLKELGETQIQDIFIIDHHEVTSEIPENVHLINPEIYDKQKISGAGLTYLFCKEIDETNREYAKLAVLGMIGDMLDKEIGKLNNGILQDGEVKTRRGLLIYPSTRPINRALEYSSQPYIPEVTGNIEGVLNLLREAGMTPENGKYKSILELDDNEMQKLITGIMLRNPSAKNEDIVGDIFLIKMYNKLEDARELSAKINACSRLGSPEVALKFCMELSDAKKESEKIHIQYRQNLVSGLKFVRETEKIEGENYVIINARKEIKDTIIGTVASIISNSPEYDEGKVIVTMAYYEKKIKVSARIAGRKGRNLRELLSNAMEKIGGEVGGHEKAAGCIVPQEKENEFIEHLKQNMEIPIVRL